MEQKQKKIILAVLVGIFIIIAASNLASGIKKNMPKRSAQPAASKISLEEEMLASDISYEPPKSKYESWGRDPFNIGEEASMEPPLKLEGIVWDDVKPFCIINGAALYAGGRYEGYTVIRIERDKVIISDGTKEAVLRLGGE